MTTFRIVMNGKLWFEVDSVDELVSAAETLRDFQRDGVDSRITHRIASLQTENKRLAEEVARLKGESES